MPTPGPNAAGRAPLRDVIARHGLTARKGLGQHFLLDRNLIRRVARAAGELDGINVLEVGPGPGGLTEALVEAGARLVVAVERDRRCVAALSELAANFPGRIRVIEGDALGFDETGLVPDPAKVVANLPYQIATALLLKWLRTPRRYRSLTLMFQKEVAERLVARPGSKIYGRLSVRTQWQFEARRLFDIAPASFVPPPRVTSTLVSLVPRERPLAAADPVALERVLAAAFGQRRKMLRTSLKQLGHIAPAVIEAAGAAPTARAEELAIDAFCALARALRQVEAD